MKFLLSQLAYLTSERDARANLRALAKYFAFLALLVTAYAFLFHVIKLQVENEPHSWVTGFYWTLVVMTTLGFGDITFTSDIGRIFSIIVLLSGVVFLLVMLPFLFIRLFYAPWLEARVRLRAPRELPPGMRDHVIIAEYDAIAAGLAERLTAERIPYVVIEPDPGRAGQLFGDRISVLAGENDNRFTYERAGAPVARMVLANCEDTTNTNITLTVREVAPDVAIVAIVEEQDSVDILQLSGATSVLALKHQLGDYLANRIETGRPEAHVVGEFRGLQIAELPARDTPFTGKSVRETKLRQQTGLSVVGFWERGKLRPAYPDTQIQPDSVLVVAGTGPQVTTLNALLPDRGDSSTPVLVIGAGKVGQAAARALKKKGLPVHAIDRTDSALAPLADEVDAVFAGDAADRELLDRAGIFNARSVLLTTNEDAMNIYLAVYCRRLNRDLRIVSRITHERNLEAIHRAGADFVLSYTTLGIEAVMSVLRGHPPVLLGEGVELFFVPVPSSLAGRPLRESGIGSRTGLSVVALQQGERLSTSLTSETLLPADAHLLMLGSHEQRGMFDDVFRRA
ncbi:MAG TPA: NAD-binding protein [Vicinamibacterales bacterium]|nr:NAD-binding protein [Vicinamibacterales bacterium]